MTPNGCTSTQLSLGHAYSLNPQYLEFLPPTAATQRILQVQLVAPNVLTITQCISVTLTTIAMDTALADGGDHDPSFGISDWLLS